MTGSIFEGLDFEASSFPRFLPTSNYTASQMAVLVEVEVPQWAVGGHCVLSVKIEKAADEL